MKDGVMCRKFCLEGKKDRMQIPLPEKLQSTVLEHLHNAVTAGHMSICRALASV